MWTASISGFLIARCPLHRLLSFLSSVQYSVFDQEVAGNVDKVVKVVNGVTLFVQIEFQAVVNNFG